MGVVIPLGEVPAAGFPVTDFGLAKEMRYGIV